MFEGVILALIEQQLLEREKETDAKILKMLLEFAPPERHAEVRAEHKREIERREDKREADRRNRELCSAIREATRYGRYY